MKRIVMLLLLCCAIISVHAQKSAILIVQFGTTNSEGRASSLDAIISDVKTCFSGYEVREAYSSPTIRRALAKKGITKDSTTDALLRLHLDGYDKVFVMPTFLLDGVEMGMLRNDVESLKRLFKEVKLGNPLLYHVSDFTMVADMLSKNTVSKKEAILYVGHGNEYASTAAYSMLGQMLKQKGSYFMGTVEGWPDRDESVEAINPKMYKSVTVIPFLLAAGVHAREDIEGEWVPALEKKGFKVKMSLKGLGEDSAFRSLIMKRIQMLIGE